VMGLNFNDAPALGSLAEEELAQRVPGEVR
jgi:hypothetical protein